MSNWIGYAGVDGDASDGAYEVLVQIDGINHYFTRGGAHAFAHNIIAAATDPKGNTNGQ